MALETKTVGGYGIVLENIEPTLKALRAAAPDLDKRMKSRIKEVGKRIVTGAKTRVPPLSPLSNWAREPIGDPNWRTKWQADKRHLRDRPGGFPRYDAGNIKSGIKATMSKPKTAKFGAVLYVVNADAAGAILEKAGRKNDPFNASGAYFIKVLDKEDSASRVIWDAYDDLGRNAVQQEIRDAVREAEEELRRRFGDGGFNETRR